MGPLFEGGPGVGRQAERASGGLCGVEADTGRRCGGGGGVVVVVVVVISTLAGERDLYAGPSRRRTFTLVVDGLRGGGGRYVRAAGR